MNNLMTVLYQQIDSAHEYATYNGQAPSHIRDSAGNQVPTPYPYAVYKLLPVANTESNRDDYTLEISCWDKSEGTSHARVLGIADSIRKALINFINLDGHNLLFLDRPNLGYIPDPDAMIKRYDVTALLKTYRR